LSRTKRDTGLIFIEDVLEKIGNRLCWGEWSRDLCMTSYYVACRLITTMALL